MQLTALMAIFFTDVFEVTAAVRGFHEYRSKGMAIKGRPIA